MTHNNNEVRVYTLYREKDIIFNKNLFANLKMGLFTANDHNPWFIKLILVFHIKSVASVYCEPGKGRAGVMIYSFRTTPGLCQNSDKAFR